MAIESLQNAMSRAHTEDEILAVFRAFLSPVAVAVKDVIYGVTDKKIGLEKAKRLKQQAYQSAMTVLDRVGNDPSLLTDDDRAALAAYSGRGGIDETTNEYFTPQFVAEGMWDALAAMGFDGGAVLEPSAGVGVFSGTKPPKTELTNIEADSTSSKINSLLHTDDLTVNSSFEKFASKTEQKFSAVIGNPPFGDREDYAKNDEKYKHIGLADQYFVTRAIDLADDGGLICMALPPRIVDRSALKKWREEISYKAEFLGAHLLPSGTFNQSGTSTTVCVAIWRKHDADLIERLSDYEKGDLQKAKVLWSEFIDGTYFEKSGKKFVVGELTYKKGNFGSIETTAKGKVDTIEIRNALKRKFNSRIDWSFLNSAEPLSEKFNDGDSRMINGRLKTLSNGRWIEKAVNGQVGKTLDSAIYGVDNVDVLRAAMTDPASVRNFTFEQLKNIQKNFPAFVIDDINQFIKLAEKQNPKHRARLLTGLAIGYKANAYQNLKTRGYDDTAARDEVIGLAQNAFSQFGDPNKCRALSGLNGKGANFYNGFAQLLDSDGNPSAALTDTIRTQKTGGYNPQDPVSIIQYLVNEQGNTVTYDDVMSVYEGDPITESQLISMSEIGFDKNGCFFPMNSYCSGNVVQKIAQLTEAISTATSNGGDDETTQAAISKWNEQIELMNERREWQSFDEITLNLSSKWIDKSLVIDFLHDAGYTKFHIDNDLVFANGEQPPFNYIQGYRFDETGKNQTKAEENFARHIENHINGNKVQSNETFRTAALRSDIAQLDKQFSEWLVANQKTREIEQTYNDRFNQYVETSHSDAPLGLEGLTGHIELLPYQNEAIRRLAEDGKGLLGFQMGLGKTFTALGLAEYKYQKGLSRRTCIVVPKSTYENWYFEHQDLYGKTGDASKNILFVGIKTVKGENGEVIQIPVLDKDGKPTGRTRDKIELLDGKEINARMHMIPNGNWKLVVMTKEQFAKIPMRPESKEVYVDQMVANETIRSHRLAVETIENGEVDFKFTQKSDYQEARRKAAQKRKYGNEGTGKSDAYPYFEDMLFDNIIVDEAHNYRNSYQAGRNTASLAWLPTQAAAKQSLDMTIKCEYVRANHNNTGTTMLSATPLVNSPTDMFNMLSLVIGASEWQEKYNIANVDDFIRVFGETATRDIEKLSGEIVPKEALIGFSNLTGLRNIFNKWVNFKEAADVAANVEIPDLNYLPATVEMSDEQAAIYQDLRNQADWLSKATDAEKEESGITVFGLIRQMDKIATDIDLYNNTITYLFEPTDADAVSKIEGLLPKSLKLSDVDEEETDVSLLDKDELKKFAVTPNVAISQIDGKIKFVVNAAFESHVESAIKKLKINENTITHPITPKYAKFLENLRNGLVDGNQIVFSEEKSQHEKLRRIISYHLDMPRSQIGIINADTINKGKKKGNEEEQQAGLEAIAADFNEGRLKVVIANKKAEVGINLHKNTFDVHLLTIPWQPASLKQKAGRAARVGSRAKEVRVWIYQSAGSFDRFRFETMSRKSTWIDNIIKDRSINKAENANADDAELIADLLAENEQERQAQRAQRKAEAEKRLKEEQRRRAQTTLKSYITQAQICALPVVTLEGEKRELIAARDREIQNMKESGSGTNFYKMSALHARNLSDQIRRIDRQLAQHAKASDAVKQLKNSVKTALESGLIDIDKAVIEDPSQFVVSNTNKQIKIGSTWRAIGDGNQRREKAISIVADRDHKDAKAKENCIVQVVAHREHLGYALCQWLYPTALVKDSRDKNEYATWNNVIVYYDDFIEETEYCPDDVLKKNVVNGFSYYGQQMKLDPTLSTNENYVKANELDFDRAILLCERFGRENFLEFVKENRISIRSKKMTFNSTDSKDKNFYFVDGQYRQFDESQLAIPYLDKFVLPPLNDLEKSKLAMVCIKTMRDSYYGKNSDVIPENRYWRSELPEKQLVAIFGSDWINNITQFSENIVPIDEALQTLESVLSDTLASEGMGIYKDNVKRRLYDSNGAFKAHYGMVEGVTASVTAKIRDLFGTKDNFREIELKIKDFVTNSTLVKAFESRYEVVKAEILNEKEIEKEEEILRQLALIESWRDHEPDQAKQRLEAFLDAQENGSYGIKYPDNVTALYGALGDETRSTDLTLKIATDIVRFEKYRDRASLDRTKLESNASALIRLFIEAHFDGKSPLEPLSKEQPAPPASTNSIAMDIADLDYLASECEVKPCTTTITVTDKRGRKGKETYKAITLEADTLIGIKDGRGFNGKLSQLFVKSRDAKANKDRYGAFFLNATEGDFVGGWWMVSAKIDFNELETELSEL